MTNTRKPLDEKQRKMMVELVSEIEKHDGAIEDEDLINRLFSGSAAFVKTDQDFQGFIMDNVMPNLNKNESLNFTASIMKAHTTNDLAGENDANLVRAGGRLSSKLYFYCVENCFGICPENDYDVFAAGNKKAEIKPLNDIIIKDWESRGIKKGDEISGGVNIVFGMRKATRASEGGNAITPKNPDSSAPLKQRMQPVIDNIALQDLLATLKKQQEEYNKNKHKKGFVDLIKEVENIMNNRTMASDEKLNQAVARIEAALSKQYEEYKRVPSFLRKNKSFVDRLRPGNDNKEFSYPISLCNILADTYKNNPNLLVKKNKETDNVTKDMNFIRYDICMPIVKAIHPASIKTIVNNYFQQFKDMDMLTPLSNKIQLLCQSTNPVFKTEFEEFIKGRKLTDDLNILKATLILLNNPNISSKQFNDYKQLIDIRGVDHLGKETEKKWTNYQFSQKTVKQALEEFAVAYFSNFSSDISIGQGSFGTHINQKYPEEKRETNNSKRQPL